MYLSTLSVSFLEGMTGGCALCSIGPAAATLPAAADALQSIAGRPRFLDPEATRPLAAPIHRGREGGLPAPQLNAASVDAETSRHSRFVPPHCKTPWYLESALCMCFDSILRQMVPSVLSDWWSLCSSAMMLQKVIIEGTLREDIAKN